MTTAASLTRTEAAKVMAIDVRVWARTNSGSVTLRLCEERVSELRGPNYAGTCKGEAAAIANPKAVFRAAKAMGEGLS